MLHLLLLLGGAKAVAPPKLHPTKIKSIATLALLKTRLMKKNSAAAARAKAKERKHQREKERDAAVSEREVKKYQMARAYFSGSI
jgi:hypothetical protein